MKIIPSFLMTLSVIFVAPNAVSQVLRSSDFNTLATTSSEDLSGVESRSIEDWNWGLGGEFPDPKPSTPLDSDSLNLDLYETKVRTLNETYEDLDNQLGDYQRPTSRFPILDF
ncbi:MAG: hypothetical protein QNJ37_21090 [Crocosphaera sp.]|nr:hypothetical protein [Crocosphaera sp.]